VHPLWSKAASTLWRSGFVAVAIAVGSLHDNVLTVLPWALLILTLDLLAAALMGFGSGTSDTRNNVALAVIGCSAIAAGAALATGQGFTTVAGVLLLAVPAFRAGQVQGRLGAALAVVAAVVVVAGVTLSRGTLTGADLAYILQWALLALALALGLLGAATAQMGRWTAWRAVTPAVHEAANLLRRLSDLAGALDGGFDAPAAAELLLQELKTKIPGSRMAVLVGVGSEPAVPLALRGIDRLPWPSPTTADSLIGRVWRTNVAEAGLWTSVNEERAIAAAPLRDPDGARIGIVVIDRFAFAPFDDDDLRALVAVAEGHSADLDVALIFAALRQHAAFEERERLAREMHDGIAQELVALGYRIDATRSRAETLAPLFLPALEEARADLTRVLSDLRLRIADLRLAMRPDQGLGAVVGARLQQFGAATGLSVGLQLSESPYRLPAHLETLIYRLVLDVLKDARNARGVSEIKAHLVVDAPQAWLRMTHNGRSNMATDTFRDHPLLALGATIDVQPDTKSGVTVSLALIDRWPSHLPYLVPEKMKLIQ
jgi:signal transduction histidine kinase